MTRRAAPLVSRLRRLPWWAVVALIFVASRVPTTVILLVSSALQPGNYFSPAHPPYPSLADYWDGWWYRRIAFSGYPVTLPTDSAGTVQQNAWAFLPAYPWLVRLLSLATGFSYEGWAIAVSVLCAFGTALVFHRILIRRLPVAQAYYSVALFCLAPLSPMLQLGYAEPMTLLLLAAVLLLVMRRRYLAATPLAVLAAFTRPVGLALGLFVLLHLVHRVLARAREPYPRRQVIGTLVLGAAAGLAGASWPLIAGVATGIPDAYTRTELAWWSAYGVHGVFVPFTPWFTALEFWLRFLGGLAETPAALLGAVIVVLLGVLTTLVLLMPSVARRLGPENRLWIASYAVYLLAVFFPQSSTFRLLMPAFPVLGALQPRRRIVRALVLVVAVALQIPWVAACWWVAGYDWSPP